MGEGSIIASGSVNNSDTAQTQLLCFPKLKKLMLWNLPQLRSILAKSGVIMACDALVQIAIWDCPLLRSVLCILPQIDIWRRLLSVTAPQMKEIVTCVKGSGIASGSINNSDTTQTQLLRLPKLKKLELWDLPQLKSMFPESGIIMVSNVLETIEVIRCPLLRRVHLHLPLLPDGQPSAPPYLQQVKIRPLEWWHSSDWGYPNANAVLRPFLRSDCAERPWDFRPVEQDVLDASATTSSSGQM